MTAVTADTQVSEVMTPSPWSIDADAMLARAEDLMRQERIRHLVVTTGGAVVGVLSERDVLFLRAFEGIDTTSVRVRAAMSPVSTHAPRDSIREVLREMAEGRYGACVVTDGKRAVGILTTVDVCRAFADVLDDDGVRALPRERVHAFGW
jgi:acetoin utilization protein AcuB